MIDQRFFSIEIAMATTIANNPQTATAAGQFEPRNKKMAVSAMQTQRAKRAPLSGPLERGESLILSV